MPPHPHSRASLLALHDQLRGDALSRARVYRLMADKLGHNARFDRLGSIARLTLFLLPPNPSR